MYLEICLLGKRVKQERNIWGGGGYGERKQHPKLPKADFFFTDNLLNRRHKNLFLFLISFFQLQIIILSFVESYLLFIFNFANDL